MITVDFVLRGQVRDAWLYKGMLIVWDRDNQARIRMIDDLQDEVRRQYGPEVAALADYCLWRNDWRAQGPARSLVAVPEVRKALGFGVRDKRITIELDSSPKFGPSGLSSPEHILDVQIYANRVYLATSKSLIESYVNPKYPEDEREAWPLLDRRVSDVEARHGAVLAAAEEDGLWLSRINFDEDLWQPDRTVERIADEAFRVSWSARNLLAYTSEPLPALLRTRGRRTRPHGGAIYDAYVIDDLEPDTALRPIVEQAVRDVRSRSPEDVPVALGNSNYRLLVAWQEDWQVVDLRAYEGKPLTAALDKALNSFQPPVPAVEVLQTYGIASGFVVEEFDAVHLITKSGSLRLIEEEAARVRTYPDSLRHFDVVTVVTEDALHLIGHWDV